MHWVKSHILFELSIRSKSLADKKVQNQLYCSIYADNCYSFTRVHAEQPQGELKSKHNLLNIWLCFIFAANTVKRSSLQSEMLTTFLLSLPLFTFRALRFPPVHFIIKKSLEKKASVDEIRFNVKITVCFDANSTLSFDQTIFALVNASIERISSLFQCINLNVLTRDSFCIRFMLTMIHSQLCLKFAAFWKLWPTSGLWD